MQKVGPAPETCMLDTIAQKIDEAKKNHTNSLLFSKDEIIDHRRIDSICRLIKEGKITNLTIQNTMIEFCVEKIIKAAKDNKGKFHAELRCVQFQGLSILNLCNILKDYPNIECVIKSYDTDRVKCTVKSINTRILSFAPDNSEDDSEDSDLDSDYETSTPMHLETPVVAAGVSKNFNLYPDPDL